MTMWTATFIPGFMVVMMGLAESVPETHPGIIKNAADLEVEDILIKALEVVANTGREMNGCSMHVVFGESTGSKETEKPELELTKITERLTKNAMFRSAQPVTMLKLRRHDHNVSRGDEEETSQQSKDTSADLQRWAGASDSCRVHIVLTDATEHLREFFSMDWINNQQDYAIVVSSYKEGLPKALFTKPQNVIILKPRLKYQPDENSTHIRVLSMDPDTLEYQEVASLDQTDLDNIMFPENRKKTVKSDLVPCSLEESPGNANESVPNMMLQNCTVGSHAKKKASGLEQILTKPTGFFLDPNDLNGKSIRVAYMPASSHVSGVEHLEVGSTVPPTAPGQCECGFEYILLMTAAEKLNFSFSLMRPKDGNWGSYDKENRSWTGMIGMLARGEADMAISAHVRVGGATEVIDYSTVFRESSSTFLSVKPGTVSPWQWVLTPFHWHVWILLGFSFVSASYIFWTVDKRFNLSKNPMIRKPDAQLTFLCHIGSLELDRFTDHPGSWSNFPRVWFSWWGMAMQVLALTYSTLLIVFLAFPPVRPPLNSLQELAVSDYFVLLRSGSTQKILFEGAQDYASKRIVDKLTVQPRGVTFVSSAKEGIYRVSTEDRTAFIFDYSQLEAEVNTLLTPAQKEKVALANSRFFQDYYLWPIRKGVPWRNHVDEVLNRLFESGIIRYWLKPSFTQYYERSRRLRLGQTLGDEYPSSVDGTPDENTNYAEGLGQDSSSGAPSSSASDDNAEPLKLAHFQGAFVLLALGYAAAVIALADELCVSVRRKDEIRKKRRMEKLNAIKEKRRNLHQHI